MKRALLLAAFALLCLPGAGSAAETLRATLERKMPGFKIGTIREGPLPGLYEVVVNGINVFYTDGEGKLGFFGNVVDLATKESLTRARTDELSYVDFSRIPLDKAIVKVLGNGTRKLVVFSDPDCPFCRQLEKSLNRLEDVTIYTMLYPIVELHPDARRKAELVWCAPDRVQAWDALMLEGVVPAASGDPCTAPVAEIARVARELFISGTPALVFEDGKLVPGALEVWQIEDRLARASEG
jgi:thiol:disulfide interchange protein DsbC